MGSVRDDAIYTVRARVPAGEWVMREDALAGSLLCLRVDWDPPASAPEVELRFRQGALSAIAAEQRARRRLEAAGLTVLAVAHQRRQVAHV